MLFRFIIIQRTFCLKALAPPWLSVLSSQPPPFLLSAPHPFKGFQTIPLEPSAKRSITFRDRLRELRCEQNLSQASLAAKIGYNPATIAGYEAGRTQPAIEVLQVFAEVLHVSVDYLTGRSNIRNPYINEEITAEDEIFLNLYLQLPEQNKIHLRAYTGYLSFLELVPQK